MIKRIATAAIYVTDQEVANRFWEAQVGFEIRRDLSMGAEARWVEMAPPGADSCIVIFPKSMMDDWHERKPSLVFECGDIEETHKSMSARGVEFSQEPKEMPWGKFAIFLDPEGNWYGLREIPELNSQRD
ncbi:MAG: VOC family protein [Candidatus Poribacteria bacterium]|nr:VOC family protein [Candidatus Poribacteria bacterium]MDE0503871.1 VOC family protein [Candidatus Poribacteria bacterium]